VERRAEPRTNPLVRVGGRRDPEVDESVRLAGEADLLDGDAGLAQRPLLLLGS